MPFCPNCGTESEATQQFCRHCGASLAAATAGMQTVGPDPMLGTGDRILPNYISPTRLLVMFALTGGLYLFYWLYLTWKQYRDHTGQEVFPVWHALTQLVPIYKWFRFHAHVRVYKDLMINSGLPSSLSPFWAVVVLIIASSLFLLGIPTAMDDLSQFIERIKTFLDLATTIDQLPQGPEQARSMEELFADLTDGLFRRTIVVFTILGFVSKAITAGVLLQVQGNLNRYWASLPEVISGRVALAGARISVVEIILIVVGLYNWFGTLTLLFSAGYQAGSFGA